MAIRNLASLSVEDREEYMQTIRRECIDYREPKESSWLKVGRRYRNLLDPSAPTRAKFYSTYLWSALQSWMSVLEPIFFTANPAFDLRNIREEDYDRNTILEKILTHQIHFSPEYRRNWMKSLLESIVFGSNFPWHFWKTQYKDIGPFRTPTMENGLPMTDSDGAYMVEETYKRVRTYHGPFMQFVSLWDTYRHPNRQMGFAVRRVTGYDLLAESGPGGLYPRDRVERILRSTEAMLAGTNSDNALYGPGFGDPEEERRFQLAREAGVEGDPSLDSYRGGFSKNALSMEYSIWHFDDSYQTGSYVAGSGGKMMELRFYKGSNYDGTSNVIPLIPNESIFEGEIYGVGIPEQAGGLLDAHTRFLQLAIDGAALTVNPQWIVSEHYDQQVGEILTGPGAINVVPVLGQEGMDRHIQRMDMPQSWHNAMQFRQFLQEELDQSFAQDDFARGRFSGGRKTAAEVTGVLEFAANRMELIADRISDTFARPMGKKWLCMNAVHLTKQDVERMVGVIGKDFEMPGIEEIIEQQTVVFKGSVLASGAASRANRMGQLAQIYFNSLGMLQIPHVQEFMRQYFELAGLEGVTKTFPATDPTIQDRLTQLMMEGKGNPGKTGTQPSESPTDLSGMLAAQGGAQGGTEPPPMNTMQA